MKKEIMLNNKLQRILQILFVISCPALCLVLSKNTGKWIIVLSLGLSFLIGFFLVMKFWKNKFEKINIFKFIISFLFSNLFLQIIYDYHFKYGFAEVFYNIAVWKLAIAMVFALFGLTMIVYYLWGILNKPIINFFKSLTKNEKRFLIFYSIGMLIITIILYNLTGVFYFAEGKFYDILYTTDSSAIFSTNVFININAIENVASRQPLFGVFSVPFGLVSYIFSKIFFMVPNSYAVFLTWIQIILVGFMMVMLARLLNIKDKSKIFFYLFFLCCYSTIIFLFTLEQYIISTFYLILAIYVYFNMKKGVNYPLAMSAGCITTSAWFFPLVSKDRKIKTWLLNALKCLLFFFIIAILSGQFYFIFDFFDSILNDAQRFGGDNVEFLDKLRMFLGFVKSIFIALPGRIIDSEHSTYLYEQYLLEPIYHFSKFAILILFICFISFILNWKNKFAKVSFSFIIFSVILILIAGYGTAENGTNLYSFYFGWAFISLIYMFIDRVISNEKFKNILIIILCIIMLILNIIAFVNIIKFGLLYYPI